MVKNFRRRRTHSRANRIKRRSRRMPRRRNRIRKSRMHTRTAIVRSLYPAADRTMIKQKLVVFFAASAAQAGGLPYEMIFNPCSPNGPSQSPVPVYAYTGYVDFANRYNQVTCMSSACKVEIIDQAGLLDTNNYAVTLLPQRTGTPFLTTLQLNSSNEVRYSKQVLVEANQASMYARRTVKNYMKTSVMNGVTDKMVREDTEQYSIPVLSLAQPASGWRWIIYIHNPWNPAANIMMPFSMRLTMTVYLLFTRSYLIPTS